MGLIALCTPHITNGVPIVETNQDQVEVYRSIQELNNAGKQAERELDTPITTSESKALQMADVDTTKMLDSVFEPILYLHEGIDGIIPDDTMYIDRLPRGAELPPKNTYICPYTYGLAKMPDTQVLNHKECVEYYLTHLEPAMTLDEPQPGCFVKTENEKNLEKVCEQECIKKNQKLIFLYFSIGLERLFKWTSYTLCEF